MSTLDIIPEPLRTMFEQMATSIKEVAEQHKMTEKSYEVQLRGITEKHKELAEQHKELVEQQKELRKEFAEQQKELHKEFAEHHKELAEQQKELTEEHKKTEASIRKLAESMGYYGNRLGEFTEHLLAPGIARSFNILGYEFDADDVRRLKIKDSETGDNLTEIDFMLENDEMFLIVEIKTKPCLNDIEDHIKRLKIFRHKIEKEGHELKKIIGAIGGVIFEKNIKTATRKAGLFVITQKGNDVQIDVPNNFIPKIF
ncbi:MAG: hypothetical protein LBQ50_02870 [Planctomycetaceae bacterium]|jgi:DNA repair exonuclease SbcCD ATPase subunit|nr:hypothetical protein [Planctomycetaceae bacterium]